MVCLGSPDLETGLKVHVLREFLSVVRRDVEVVWGRGGMHLAFALNATIDPILGARSAEWFLEKSCVTLLAASRKLTEACRKLHAGC
jgi:hypothetical protein